MSQNTPLMGLPASSGGSAPGAVPVLAQINEHVFRLFHADMREAYTNAAKFVEMNLAVFQYYGLDLPGFYYDIYNIEAEALGQRIHWDPRRMPDIDRAHPLICEPRDLDRLKPPGFQKDSPDALCPGSHEALLRPGGSPCASASAPPFLWRSTCGESRIC